MAAPPPREFEPERLGVDRRDVVVDQEVVQTRRGDGFAAPRAAARGRGPKPSSASVIPSSAAVPAGAPSMRRLWLGKKPPSKSVSPTTTDYSPMQMMTSAAQKAPRAPEMVGVGHGDQADRQSQREEDEHADRGRDGEDGGGLAVAAAREVAFLWGDAAEAAHVSAIPRPGSNANDRRPGRLGPC